MKLKRLAALVLVLSSVACAARTTPTRIAHVGDDSETARLVVLFAELESDEGEIAVALYASVDDFRSRSGAVASGWIESDGGKATWTVEALTPGRYAVAAYQDLNGNRELDRPAIGPPSEPYGFSNDARGTFGPPSFDEAAFDLAPGTTTIEIALR